MRFSIKYKIFFFVTFILLSAIVASSYIYYNNIRAFAKEYAFKDLTHDINILTRHIKSMEEEIDNIINIALNNENIIMSLNLISNYQDKEAYEREIFDVEKKKILTNIKNLLGRDNSWSMAIFDAEGDMVSFKRKKKEKIIFGYSTYINKKIQVSNSADELIKGFKPKKIDRTILNRHDIFSRKDEFVFKKAVPVNYNNSVIGYIRVGFVISDKNYFKLSNAIQNGSIMISESLKVGAKNFSLDPKEVFRQKTNTLLEFKDTFVVYNVMQSIDNIALVTFTNKDKLDKTLLSTLKGLIYISLIILLVLLILTIVFSNYFINTPLNKLLEGIKALRNNELKKIKIESNDEISIIAKEFNEISFALSKSFKSLETSNLLLENILDTVHMSIFIKDIEGKYIKGNKNFLKDCGFESEDELLGKSDHEVWKKEDADFFRGKDLNVIETLEPIFNLEQNQTRSNNDTRIVLVSKMPLVDKSGKIVGVLGVYDDITEQKAKEQKLKEKEAYLLQQSRLAQMGEMISMIAHQWRQPLAAISSTANGLMLKNMMGKYEKEFFADRLKNIGEYSQHLSSTIDDFRNFFKKNKEKREIKLENIVNDSLKITLSSLENKHIDIIKEFKCFESFNSFPNELRQVVLNLIKNAEDILDEKEMDNKWIKIKTLKGDGGKYILEVSDNAGGVPDDILEKIFEPYFSTKSNKDGTGLGLYMSKTIIEDHCGGKLSVRNDNDGAIFKVEI